MTERPKRAKKPDSLSLREQLLLAALECSNGDIQKTFTAEDLLLRAWARDPAAWGLRGHEREHPDSEKIYVTIDRAQVKGRNVRGGLVGIGWFERVRERTYRLTLTGLALASEVAGADPSTKGTAERALADAITAILSHPVLADWLTDPTLPKYFRDAGHFWGIAPGTPPSVIRARISDVDNTLKQARSILDSKGVDEISSRHGQTLFDRNDVERATEFQIVLKGRFKKDLSTLQVVID